MNVWLIRAGRMAAALGVWLLLGGWIGIVLGVATYAVAGRLLRRVESPARRREREQIRADLPYAADLLAATVRAGMPTDLALRTVGTALAGPLGRRFVQVADGLRIGLEPGDAWSVLRAGSESARLVEAVLRSCPRRVGDPLHGSGDRCPAVGAAQDRFDETCGFAACT